MPGRWPPRGGGSGGTCWRPPGFGGGIQPGASREDQEVLGIEREGWDGGWAVGVPPPPPAFCVLPATFHSGSAPHPQQSLKAESRPLDGSSAQLPILADMLLYYCRFAARPVLLQVYQTEVSPAPRRRRPRPAPCPCSPPPRAEGGGGCPLMPPLYSAADLRHRGEDDRDLPPLPGAGSLCRHTCHQGFRWVPPGPQGGHGVGEGPPREERE